MKDLAKPDPARLRDTDILEQLGAVEQGLVFSRVNEDGCTPSMLRQNYGTLGTL